MVGAVQGRSEEEKQQGRDAIGRKNVGKIRKEGRKEGRREERSGNIPTCIPTDRKVAVGRFNFFRRNK
jgi:hypothetical protein